MEISPKPGKELRSRIGRIAAAIAFAVMICSIAVGPLRADGHGKGKHHDRDWGERGPNIYYYAPQPDYYYVPPPDYYYAPEPDYYYAPAPDYYAPEPQPEYYPPPPSEGIHLFFGF